MRDTTILYYADQFRGFDSTIITLRQVNFLVGENSTGKTSVLNLVNLLNDFNFWFNLDFNQENISLGTFEDIRSKASSSETFTIGLLRHTNSAKGPSYYASLLKFGERDGMPQLFDYIVATGGVLLNVDFKASNVRYRWSKLKVTDNGDCEQLLREVVQEEQSKSFQSMNYKSIEDLDYPRPSVMIVNQIIEQDKALASVLKGFSFVSLIKPVRIAWIAPIRAKPRPVYLGTRSPVSAEGDHIPFIFKSIIEESRKGGRSKDFSEALKQFGKESGLFDDIRVLPFGKTKTAPFELDVIMEGKAFKISSVGYGVSQIFPIVIDMLVRSKGTMFAVQQPEVHLHPRAQAAFGELLFQVAQKDKKRFVVETHSDFLIDRFRYAQANSPSKTDAQILFFDNDEGRNRLTSIPIGIDGKYPATQPPGFRSFFVNESIRVLDI